MESLTGATIAALTIYDMLKPIDELLVIESVKLLAKSGGMKDFYERVRQALEGSCNSHQRFSVKRRAIRQIRQSSLLKGFRVVDLRS